MVTKEIKVTLYSFDELCEIAQSRAIDMCREDLMADEDMIIEHISCDLHEVGLHVKKIDTHHGLISIFNPKKTIENVCNSIVERFERESDFIQTALKYLRKSSEICGNIEPEDLDAENDPNFEKRSAIDDLKKEFFTGNW